MPALVDVFGGLGENLSHSVAFPVECTSLCTQLSPVVLQKLLKPFCMAGKQG